MIKFISELGPLIAFFVGYKYWDIQIATLCMLIASILCITISYCINKKIQTFSLVSSGILLVTAIMTLLSGNSVFIKIKPTILYVFFSIVFLFSALKNKPFMRYLLQEVIHLCDRDWNILSYRFAAFFVCMAFANEIVWRNYREHIWVKFKVFGAIPCTIIFIILNIPFIYKNKINK